MSNQQTDSEDTDNDDQRDVDQIISNSDSKLQGMLSNGLRLAIFGLAGAALLAAIHWLTSDRIAAEERRVLLQSLQEICPVGGYDNDVLEDFLVANDIRLGSGQKKIYRAKMAGEVAQLIFESSAPDGYSGPIQMLIGVDPAGQIIGVRVTQHKETPGLGDAIESNKSDWVLGFAGRSIDDPGQEGWAVKRDGGEFDQFSGATITPRAVVRTVRNTLEYFRDHQQTLLDPSTPSAMESAGNE